MIRFAHGPRHQARLAWLRSQAPLLAQLPDARGLMTEVQRETLEFVARRLVALGLYTSQDRAQIRWGVRLLVSELRQEAAP